MSSLRKVVPHNSVVYVTTSVEEGLMFPPNALIEEILKSCMARAQALFPLHICAKLFTATHAHFLFYIEDPEHLKGFMGHFKTESAHAINRLLGRKKQTVWCEGYDSPFLLTEDKVQEKLAYIYANPSSHNLTDSIDDYPGLNSYELSKKGGTHTITTKLIPRSSITKLPDGPLTEQDFLALKKELCHDKRNITLTIEPDAWMEVFGITEESDKIDSRNKVTKELRQIEEENHKARTQAKQSTIGARRLVNTQPGTPYQPARSGRKTLCLGSDKEQLHKTRRVIRALIYEGKLVYQQWKLGNTSVPYPLGLYPPAMPKLCYPIGPPIEW